MSFTALTNDTITAGGHKADVTVSAQTLDALTAALDAATGGYALAVCRGVVWLNYAGLDQAQCLSLVRSFFPGAELFGLEETDLVPHIVYA